MTLFADSSALVTRYAEEPGRPELDPARSVIVSQLARVEVPSAIWRKHRLGQVSVEDASLLVAAFEADYAGLDSRAGSGSHAGSAGYPLGYVVVLVAQAILDRAARFIASYGLRAYDSVQLASARTVDDVVPECRTFAGYGLRLRYAAASEGFRLFPAEL